MECQNNALERLLDASDRLWNALDRQKDALERQVNTSDRQNDVQDRLKDASDRPSYAQECLRDASGRQNNAQDRLWGASNRLFDAFLCPNYASFKLANYSNHSDRIFKVIFPYFGNLSVESGNSDNFEFEH